MSSEVETSRDETNSCLRGILRLRCAPLRMTARLCAGALFALADVSAAAAQEPPALTPSLTPDESPSLSASPAESVTASPTPEQTPSASPARNVRISFVPPPLEGTISLGIYDRTGKLVRVLHQEAKLNEFKIGADALVTQWDGKNDDQGDLPAGKYHARGYLVGPLKVEELSHPTAAGTPPGNNPTTNVKVKLVPNPLANDKRSIVDVGIGFDSDGSYLKTIDELPLFTVSESPNLVRASITKNGEKSVDVWQDDGAVPRQFRVSNVDKMMAFDCGEFELK
jgi:hypothetical protein